VIEGIVEGDVRASGQLTLGRRAQVGGELHAHDVRIAGTLHRSVSARGVIHLLSTAEVRGDLEAARVVIDDGAVFEGQVRLLRTPSALHTASAPRPAIATRAATPGDEPAKPRPVPELSSPGRRRLQRRTP
jgi:cytoskeletal protein CcmA (bactofilin family)